jgi:heme/copper-type cytochrome/quinol oxidase subunit 3
MTTVPLPAPGAGPAPDAVLPARTPGYGTARWGMVSLILTEAMIFGGLLGSYFFLRAAAKQWPPPGVELPELPQTIVFSIVLWASSAPVVWAEHAVRHDRLRAVRVALALSFVMGAAFMFHTLDDFGKLHFGWRDHAYGSIYYTTVGLHAIHVVIGLLMSAVIQVKAWTGRLTSERHKALEVFGLYWHFVDAVWVFVFASLVLSPHIR